MIRFFFLFFFFSSSSASSSIHSRRSGRRVTRGIYASGIELTADTEARTNDVLSENRGGPLRIDGSTIWFTAHQMTWFQQMRDDSLMTDAWSMSALVFNSLDWLVTWSNEMVHLWVRFQIGRSNLRSQLNGSHSQQTYITRRIGFVATARKRRFHIFLSL